MEPETKAKYRETAVLMDGIRWGRDPRRQRFISDGFLLLLSRPSGMGVSPWLIDPDSPLPIGFAPFQQQGWCWGTPAWAHGGHCLCPTAAVPREATRHAKWWQPTQSCPPARAAMQSSQKSSWHLCNIISVCSPPARKIWPFGRVMQLSC